MANNGGQTTVAGNEFIRKPLETYMSDTDRISLPGISKENSKKLNEFGIMNAAQLFGQYLAFGLDDEMFINYLKNEVKVTFVGNQYGSAESYEKKLCHALREKWEIIKKY